jgi:dienelactone hydrolase
MAQAQYNVNIDSIFIPTNYPYGCTNCNVDFSQVWYNDVDIRIITRGNIVTGNTDCPNNRCPTIILTPGGGFLSLIQRGLIYEGNEAQFNANDTVSLAVSLAKKGYTVIVPKYSIATKQDSVELYKMLFVCASSNVAKAKLQYYHLTAFHDFRRTLRLYLNSADSTAKYKIDNNNVVLAGFSAGGILALNTLFVESNEMPGSIPNLPLNLATSYTAATRTQHYPIPPLKGVIALTAGTFFPNCMNNNYNKNIPLYLLHGTCDNIISQDVGRAPYKCINVLNGNLFLNNKNTSQYHILYGSSWLFKKLLANSYPVRFDQVCFGGHSTVPSINEFNYDPVRDNTWDEYVPSPRPLPAFPTPSEIAVFNQKVAYWNANKHKNQTRPVEDRIIEFCNSVFSNPRTFISRLSGFQAEGPENCTGDTTDVIPITNLTLSGVNCIADIPFPRLATLSGGNESVLYYWRFGGNPNVAYRTFGPVINLDTIPQNIEFSNCRNETGICKIYSRCDRDITVLALNGCDTILYSHLSGVEYSCSGTCCITCSNNPSGRLATTDGDNSNIHTETEALQAAGDRTIFLTLSSESQGSIMIFNSSGQLVAKSAHTFLPGKHQVFLDIQKQLPAGVYMIHYIDTAYNKALSEKIIFN